jgi:hypothetical protein
MMEHIAVLPRDPSTRQARAFVVHANLDCEAVWAEAPLPPAVAGRISYYAALLAALAPPGAAVEVWAPAAVDASRLLSPPPWTAPVMRVGTPPRADAVWADPAARAANDRRLALAVAAARGAALPGQRTIASADEIDLPGPWVCKAPWTAAGRDRCRGAGPPTQEQRARIGRLLARGGELVLEPWCDRVVDAGVCVRVNVDGTVMAHPPHTLLADARGGFLGIDLAPPALEAAERARLAELVEAAGAALAKLGYAGPYAVDAFAYHEGEHRRFHPLCEINARLSFGWIARALADRLGTRRLGFGQAPPGARVLIAPAGDGVTAWCA